MSAVFRPKLKKWKDIWVQLTARVSPKSKELALNDVPKAFKGIPIALVTAGILAMAFMGFSGLV